MWKRIFQSNLPIREETRGCRISPPHPHFNPLFPYGKRRSPRCPRRFCAYFNPLFPYGKRRDETEALKENALISIHSSHTGRDWMLISPRSYSSSFQSTLPIREETGQLIFLAVRVVHFNPLFPYGKRRLLFDALCRAFDFNPLFPYGKRLFLPGGNRAEDISIHSSHTGRDDFLARRQPGRRYFNPLFPYGKRRPYQFTTFIMMDFNPLFPYGKRLESLSGKTDMTAISIHSSHTGRDAFRSSAIIWYSLFQSTLPIREETVRQHPVKGACKHFNPLFPYGKRRSRSHSPPAPSRYFNPLFPYGKRRTILLILRLARRISIHSSHTGRDHRNGNI